MSETAAQCMSLRDDYTSPNYLRQYQIPKYSMYFFSDPKRVCPSKPAGLPGVQLTAVKRGATLRPKCS